MDYFHGIPTLVNGQSATSFEKSQAKGWKSKKKIESISNRTKSIGKTVSCVRMNVSGVSVCVFVLKCFSQTLMLMLGM